jgi:hypothetical protein
MARPKATNCKQCNIVLTQDNSTRHGKLKSGNPRLLNICKPCRSKEVGEWVKKNKEWAYLYQKTYRLSFQKRKIKLTKKDVLMIRKLKEEGMPAKEIALKFEIYPSRVSNIIAKRAWKHV